MKTRFLLFFLLLSGTIVTVSASGDRTAFLENFEFQGRSYRLDASFSAGQADLWLRGGGAKNLSAGMVGENILLGIRSNSDNFYVFWLNYHGKNIRLAFYDDRRNRSRILPLSGFSFIGFPEIIEENGDLQGLMFLGNRSKNDDIFYYEPENDLLTALTATPFSEKGFTLQEKDGQLEIETKSLQAKYRYRFDRQNRQSKLLKEEPFSQPQQRQRRAAAIVSPEYYNTYIGFGDSITWGQIRAVQRLDLCYLTQMRDVYLALNYGPAEFINLGVPGDDTYLGTLHVNQDLNEHSAFYFLLMLGVNDVWRNEFSLASSLENLEFIIDAALAHGMRVIVSTLTPRKDPPHVYHQYYWDHLHSLSDGILALAAEKGTASIDTLDAFMNTDPPDGWKDLLETPGKVIVDGIEQVVKGNHPNAAGHRLIASLFADALVQFPPQDPQNIAVIDPLNTQRRTASWSVNYESDFSHFHVEFGFHAQEFPHALDTAASYCTFALFPFLPQLFFRVQAVDRGNHASGFSVPGTVAAPAAPARQEKRVPARGEKDTEK